MKGHNQFSSWKALLPVEPATCHLPVRILPPQPGSAAFGEFPSFDEKGPPNAGFSHRQKSLETDVRTFWVEHSQKSPAESRKTPVFWRLALETEE